MSSLIDAIYGIAEAIGRALAHDWTATAAVAATVQTLVVIAALAYARAQVKQARLLREDQSRPFVVIDFDAQRLQPMVYMVITNLGATVARNVRFSFSPPLRTTWEQQSPDEALSTLKLFAEGIPALPPRKEISFFFDSAIDLFGDDNLAKIYDVSIEYEAELGGKKKTYTDRTSLDLEIYKHTTYTTRLKLHDLAKQVEKIADELPRVTAALQPPKSTTRGFRASP